MTNPTTAELREMLAKATPGPWEVGPVDDTVVTHLGADGIRREIAAIDGDYNEPDLWPIMEANAALIVAAVNSLPSLLDTIDALEAERDALLEALRTLVDQRDFHFHTIEAWDRARALTERIGQ